MSWKRKVFIALLIVSIISFGIFMWMSSGDVRQSNLGGKYSGYVQYVLGTEIDFASGGNSAEFVKSNIGWGGQEPGHRCIVGSLATLKFFVQDGTGTPLLLKISGFGVFDAEKYTAQEITVFANGSEIAKWNIAGDTELAARIPGYVMSGDTLDISFNVAHPYQLGGGPRALGMAVKKISLEKQFAAKTKIKIGKWLKQKLGALPPEMTE